MKTRITVFLHWSTGAARVVAALMLFTATAHAQSTVVGRVTDTQSAQPIAGVTLQIEGTTLGATSGADGRYRIANVAADSMTVIARRIGYVSARRRVSATAGQATNVDFDLEVSATLLDQVLVTGTAGGEARRSIGNAVTTIAAADVLAKSSVTTLTTLLTARAPGVLVLPTTGRLGAGPDIRIRGRSSLSLSNSPLIYVDGVRINNATPSGPVPVAGGLGGGPNGQASQVGGRLNDINPDDIESIEVISGPAAATIYGTEASSGVIQIITKRGRAGDKPAMSLRMETGSLYFRDAEDRVQTNYYKDKSGAIVTWNGVKQEADSGRPLFRTGLTRQYTGTAAGGRDQMRYYISSEYENDYGIEPNNAMRQFSARANLSTPLTSTTDLTTSFNYAVKSEHLGADISQGSALYGAEFGQPVLYPASRGFAANIPPEVPQVLWDNADGINRLIGSMTLNSRPLTWFTQRAVIGVDYTTEDARAIEHFAPPALATILSPAQAGGRIGQTLSRTTMVTADYSGTAKVELTPRISSSSSVGGQFYNTEANSSFLGGSGFPAPGLETVNSASTAATATQSQRINTTIGAYAQQQFGWQNRLFATAALRVDNNSAFGEDFKWVTYPKLGASWVVNEEPWWRWSSVNTLRIRGAYGESGRQPASFSALRTFTTVPGANAITPATIGNPDLKPERGKELEIGLEANVWNRLEVDFTYFNKKTIDAIVTQPVAPSSGVPSTSNRMVNLGRVDNHGVEVQATFQAVKRRDIAWEIAGNVATMKDQIKSGGGLLPSAGTFCGGNNVVGYPTISAFCRRVISADRDPVTGFATNVRCDGNDGNPAGVPCATAPYVYLGPTLPTVTGAITNTINAGNRLRFYVLTDFNSGRREASNTEITRCTGAVGLCRANYYPQEYSPIYLAEATNDALQNSYLDQYYMDGSYIKLREISASYNIPERWLGGMQTTFTLAARELHTWTHFRGLDPDAQSMGTDQAVTPPLSRILATLNVRW